MPDMGRAAKGRRWDRLRRNKRGHVCREGAGEEATASELSPREVDQRWTQPLSYVHLDGQRAGMAGRIRTQQAIDPTTYQPRPFRSHSCPSACPV